MPRDISGNYTLPAGNPVVTGTIIDVAWANPTMSDIATQLNGVMTRDGVLAPTGPIRFTDGSAAAPAISFSGAAATGFYRSGATLGVAIAGSSVGIFSAFGLQLAQSAALSSGVTTLNTDGSVVIQGEGGGTNSFVNLRFRNFAGDVTRDNIIQAGSLVTSGFSHLNFSGTTQRNLFQADLFTTTSMTVAQLPSASSVVNGTRAFVTDCVAGTFGAVVVGGGANQVPVYVVGSSWYVG